MKRTPLTEFLLIVLIVAAVFAAFRLLRTLL